MVTIMVLGTRIRMRQVRERYISLFVMKQSIRRVPSQCEGMRAISRYGSIFILCILAVCIKNMILDSIEGMMAERSKALESGYEISSPKGREFESPSCQTFLYGFPGDSTRWQEASHLI
jgi:hypothetical protein